MVYSFHVKLDKETLDNDDLENVSHFITKKQN